MTVLVLIGGYTLFVDIQLQLQHGAEVARQTNELCGFAIINVQPPTFRFPVFISMVGRAAHQIRKERAEEEESQTQRTWKVKTRSERYVVQPPTFRFPVFISMVGRAGHQIRISFGLNAT
ncbi:hypothetical protein A4X13_0g8790, partial [Tilletia indica]